MKISEFITHHYSSGELNMEYIKCIENKCSFCIGSPWRSPTLKGVPRPMPDVSKLPSYHYLDVFDTPLVNNNKLRPPDDFMPRAVVKKLFKEGELQNMEDIKIFANQYVVKAEIVNDYIKHQKNIEFTKQSRATVTKYEANTRKTKKYEDYNWSAMIMDDSIGKLTVIELNKFLQANKLPQQVNKLDKIKTIVNHLQVTELSIPLRDDTDEDEEVILAATVTDNEEAEAEANLRSKSGRLRRPTHTFNSDFVFY